MGTNEEQYAQWAKTQKILEDRAAAEALAKPGIAPRGGPVLPLETVDVNSLPDAPSMYGGGAIGQPPPPPKMTIGEKIRGVGDEARKLGIGGTNTEDTDDPALTARRAAGKTEGGNLALSGTRTGEIIEPSGPPAPPDQGGSGAGDMGSTGGSAGTFIPGRMAPYSEERDVLHGKGVAPGVRENLDFATGLHLQANALERDANEKFYDQQKHAASLKLQANQSAMLQQQRLNEDRDREVNNRLAEIETLNKEARGKPEDIWSSPVIFGRLAGALLFGLGAAAMLGGGKGTQTGMGLMLSGTFVNGLINQDIQAKLDERKQAGAHAKAQTDLLHLYMDKFGNEKQAIEATKLAYYDSVLQQMEMINAEHQGDINEPKFMKLQGDVISQRAEAEQRLRMTTADTINDKQVHKQTADRVVDGAGAGGHKEPDFVVTTPGGVSYAVANKEAKNKYDAEVQSKLELIRMTNRINALRTETDALPAASEQREVNMGLLREIEQAKLKKIETDAHQGVLRSEEYPRAKELTGHATGGLEIQDRVLKGGPPVLGGSRFKVSQAANAEQVDRWTKDLEEGPKATGSPIVKRRVAVNPATGEAGTNTVMTGQLSKGDPGMAPEGSTGRVGQAVRTMPPSAEETTPQAPRAPWPKDIGPPAEHHKKKKK